MYVDDKITHEFLKGDITAQAYRAYLRQMFDQQATVAAVTANGSPLIHKQKADEMHRAFVNGEFTIPEEWEQRYVSDQRFVDNPSDKQTNRLNMIWGRYKGS